MKLMVLDGNSIVNRAYYGVGSKAFRLYAMHGASS